ncbi:MAG: hypothetical protein ACQESR_03465 [Planctomycetota bacterium]
MRYSAFAVLGFVGFVLMAGLLFFQNLMAETEVLDQRRAQLQQMSDAEKTRLLEKKERFEALSAAEQDRYRVLHEKLVDDPRYEELRATLQRYSDWFKTITPTDRAELAKLGPEDRLARVRELMDEQATERFRLMVNQVFKSKNLLNRQDLDVICEWTDTFLRGHADEILATMPDQERFAKMRAQFDPDRHMHWLRFLYFRHHPMRFRGPPPSDRPSSFPPRGGARSEGERGRKAEPTSAEAEEDLFDKLPEPSPDEVAKLKSQVSREARDVLEKATEEGERTRIIQNWMRAAFLSRIMPPVNRKELDRFVRESLSKDEREWLESMPRDRMYHELRKLYFRKRFHGERHETRRRGGKRRKDSDFRSRGDPRERPRRDRRGDEPGFGDGPGPPRGPGRGGRPGPRRTRGDSPHEGPPVPSEAKPQKGVPEG